MSEITLNGPLLREMILESYDRINQKTDYLNEINVFPIPDGDTGINIYSTMSKIVEELNKQDSQTLSIKDASKAIAKGAFMGAKGNSGVILSQFFVGFAKSIEDKPTITTINFAEALIEGSKRAYKAVMNPREGTILTVVRDTAEAAVQKTNDGANWKEVVEYCYEIAQKSTLDTPNLLQDLKDAGVVDAGALGFVYLIQGWLFVIANIYDGPKVLDIRQDLENLHNSINAETTVSNIAHRYCTEAMVVKALVNEETAKSKMLQYGEFLLVIKDEDQMKLHVHSNSPYDAIQEFAKFGKLKAAKIDDMATQTLSSHT